MSTPATTEHLRIIHYPDPRLRKISEPVKTFDLALRELVRDVPPLPGTEDSAPSRLQSLFEQAGFVQLATTSFDVAVEFPDFDAFWTAQTPSYMPTTKLIAAMELKNILFGKSLKRN